MALQPSDYVEFRTIPDFREIQTISLEGEFVFPGVYAFDKGETLSSVIQRAGGFTDEAFTGGSVFLRESLRVREEQELKRLTATLQAELQTETLSEANSDIDIDQTQLALQEKALEELSTLQASGRLVIPLEAIVNFAAEDILLRADDRLLVPKFNQEVTVIGEVHRPISYLYQPGFSQTDYIEQSGGLKQSADKKSIYVVKASGRVIKPTRGFFRFRSAQAEVGPGDTIVVPLDTYDEKIRPMALLAEASQIIYQLSLGAAAINTFNN
jgi:polysaccharide export outer membrane protein